MSANKLPPNPCYGCSGLHFQMNCPLKSKKCFCCEKYRHTKHSLSETVIGEVINLKINVFAMKSMDTQKNSASGVVVGEIISVSPRLSWWR